ncbi:hypothetical protein PHYBOEH_007977 [Phytophthora boehmeriae]|uniref:M96 mating-specific protein family n=1 Tax=Phytophthora boehmeriae TaxID=109152 RepID=A0A8T1W4I4_9STRA|nr:hypothetical protein PHYBOEH_007977 [Phytophthora boehmeriae]
MADEDKQLLADVDEFGFVATQDAAQDALALEDIDAQQLLADTDEFLQSLNATTETAYKIKETTDQQPLTKQEHAKFLAGQRRDAYRQRVKNERATLKQQDAELSRELAQLQKIKLEKPTVISSRNDSVGLTAWKAVALRQYESRLEAEALKKQLLAAVNNQAVMIRDLEKVLKKRVREVANAVQLMPDTTEKKARFGEKEAVLYKTYFENLDSLYARLDEVFKDVGTTPTPGGILSGEPTRKMDGETEYFETIGVGRVPFNYQRTCAGVWELLSVPHRVDGRRVCDGLPDPENSLAIQFCSPIRGENGDEFKLWSNLVARRYVEESRMVVVWKCLCEPDGNFPGYNSDETGWSIVHAPSSSLNDVTTTLVQACTRLVPMYFQNGKAKEEETMDQFVKLVVETNQEDNKEIGRMMERLILDDAIATSCTDDLDQHGNLTSTVI